VPELTVDELRFCIRSLGCWVEWAQARIHTRTYQGRGRASGMRPEALEDAIAISVLYTAGTRSRARAGKRPRRHWPAIHT